MMSEEKQIEEPIVLRCNEDGEWEKYEPYATIDCQTEEDYEFLVRAVEEYKKKQSKWISVEERLPEENVAVLIWHGKIDVAKIHKGITKADREKMERGELLDPMEFGWTLGGVVSIPRSKSFKGCDEFGNNHVPYNWVAISGPMEWFGQDVSYWMPLPEPPKTD